MYKVKIFLQSLPLVCFQYFKDKKSAVKKKFSQIRLARQQTGGGAIDEIIPSVIEEKNLSLMGGEEFAVGDRELEINPFHVVTHFIFFFYLLVYLFYFFYLQ